MHELYRYQKKKKNMYIYFSSDALSILFLLLVCGEIPLGQCAIIIYKNGRHCNIEIGMLYNIFG